MTLTKTQEMAVKVAMKKFGSVEAIKDAAEAGNVMAKNALTLISIEKQETNTQQGIDKDESIHADGYAFISSNKLDNKGREIGYHLGYKLVDNKHYAWVQNARKEGGISTDYGVAQRSKEFKSEGEAKRWAMSTAQERISKLK